MRVGSTQLIFDKIITCCITKRYTTGAWVLLIANYALCKTVELPMTLSDHFSDRFFVGLPVVTNTQTDRQRHTVCSNRPHVCYACDAG